MDYSDIGDEVREKIAEQVAMAVLSLENVAQVAQPAYVLDSILKVRQDLRQLVKDLGGHPAIR